MEVEERGRHYTWDLKFAILSCLPISFRLSMAQVSIQSLEIFTWSFSHISGGLMVGTHEHHAQIYVMLNWWSITVIMLHFGEESQFLFCLKHYCKKTCTHFSSVIWRAPFKAYFSSHYLWGISRKWNDHCDGHSIFVFFFWYLPCIIRKKLAKVFSSVNPTATLDFFPVYAHKLLRPLDAWNCNWSTCF